MYILHNETTRKELKLSDKVARDVFGLTEKQSYLLCLPVSHAIPAATGKNIQIRHERKRVTKIGGICVIRMGGLGDLIILSSTLVKLKKKYPSMPLTLATTARYVPIMKGLKDVDLCISVDDLEKYSFERRIDLRYAVEPPNIGPGSLSWRRYVSYDRADNFDALCGVGGKRYFFNLPVDRAQCADLHLGQCPKPLIVFCPTTASTVRAVPPDYVAPTVNQLRQKTGGTVILIGRTEAWNKDLNQIQGKNIINWLDQTTDAGMIAVCSMADLIISPDTGVLHVAGALKKRGIGLFGNIDPATRISHYKTVTAIYRKGKMPCIPCHDVPGACDATKPGAPCMRLITPDVIVRAAKEKLR